jgi:hypothetical protein
LSTQRDMAEATDDARGPGHHATRIVTRVTVRVRRRVGTLWTLETTRGVRSYSVVVITRDFDRAYVVVHSRDPGSNPGKSFFRENRGLGNVFCEVRKRGGR